MYPTSLPRLHPLTGAPLRPVGYRRNGKPIWPILGGSEPLSPPPGPPAPPPPAPPGPPPPPAPPAPPEPDRGFPENTPLVEMTTEQQLAYHRHHSRQWQARAESRRDYDAVKAKADQFDELQRQQMTPSEQAIQAARDAGRAEATATANQESVQTLLRVALSARGKSGAELDTLVNAANPAAFITDGKVVADTVTAYATALTGAPGGGGGGRPFDFGQGRREGGTGKSVATGRELYAQARGKASSGT